MKFDWNPDKNEWLRTDRNITFEEINYLIEAGHLLAILKHSKKTNQNMFVVERGGYAHHVPYVIEKDGTHFLKTIYPSRASTKKYIGEEHE